MKPEAQMLLYCGFSLQTARDRDEAVADLMRNDLRKQK